MLIIFGLLAGGGLVSYLRLHGNNYCHYYNLANPENPQLPVPLHPPLLSVLPALAQRVDRDRLALLTASSSSMSLISQRLLAEGSLDSHPKQTENGRHVSSSSSLATRREFEAGTHEVASGPNPISNR